MFFQKVVIQSEFRGIFLTTDVAIKIQIRVCSIIENWVIKCNRNQKQENQPKKIKYISHKGMEIESEGRVSDKI